MQTKEKLPTVNTRRKDKLVNRVDYVQSETSLEPIRDSISLAVPNEAYTIKELLIRHQQGLGANVQRQGVMGDPDDEDFDQPDLNQMQHADLFEREEYSTKLAETIRDQSEFIKAETEKHAAKKKADKRKEFEDEFNEMEQRKKASASSSEKKGGTTEGSDTLPKP